MTKTQQSNSVHKMELKAQLHYYFITENLDTCMHIIKKIEENGYSFSKSDLVKICIMASKRSDAHMLENYLDLLIKSGFTNDKDELNEFSLELLENNISKKTLNKRIQQNKDSYTIQTRFPEHEIKLLDYSETDQKNRKYLNNVVAPKYGVNSRQYDSVMNVQRREDSLNTERMWTVIAEIGYPSYSKVGKSAEKKAFTIVQHGDINLQKAYLELMLATDRGDFTRKNVAYLTDRIRTRFGYSLQLYGTQFTYDSDSDKWKLDPVENEERLDSLRADLGMYPIDWSIKIWNLKGKTMYTR